VEQAPLAKAKGAFLWCARQGRTYLEVKVRYSPDKGKSWPNGKGVAGDCESEGKALV
jgi:hypothetical protein